MKTITIGEYEIFASTLGKVGLDKKKTLVINTINAHSYMVAKKDHMFKKALVESDILLPDGEGIVLMAKLIGKKKIKKIAGADIHNHLLEISEEKGLKCFYLGSSQETLEKIKSKLKKQYQKIDFGFFSPPFKSNFDLEDNRIMINAINSYSPDVLFVGMTAPKQEKWVHSHRKHINASAICSIGAVFDFVAGTKRRAPKWVIKLKMEWLYRSFTAWRLTKRYLYSTPLFLIELLKLRFFSNTNNH